MENVCEVCGGDSVGFQHLLLTCSMCNSTRTHVYCLRKLTLEIPDVWNCESCPLGNDRISAESPRREESLSSSNEMGHSRKLPGPRKVTIKGLKSVSGWKLHSKKQKPVETGKVKFLSQDEVVKLSSGATTKRGSPLKTGLASMLHKTTPTKPKPVNPKFFAERVEKATPPATSRPMKPFRDGALSRSLISNQQASRTSKELKERTPLTSGKGRPPKKRLLDDLISAELSQDVISKEISRNIISTEISQDLILAEISRNTMDTFTNNYPCARLSSRPIDSEKKTPALPTKEHVAEKQLLITKKQPVDALIRSRELDTSNKKTQKELAETPSTPLPSRHSPLDINAGGNTDDNAEHNHSNFPEEDLANIPPNVDLYLTYLPALYPTWKGGFSIIDSTISEVLDGFQAQPPCKVRREAYEISTKMPPILQLKMLPWLHLWPGLLEDGGPYLQDIALYFFPADNNMKRYGEKYGELFERMEIHSSIMIGHVNDVELLIFTSKQLNINSQNILLSKEERFFCGFFRKPPSEGLPELPSAPLSCPYPNEANMDNGADEDMEIDMVGGQSVGIVDYFLPRYSPSKRKVMRRDSPTRRINEPKTDEHSSALLKPQAKLASVSREMDLSLSPKRPLVKFKLEPRKGHNKSPGLMNRAKLENAFETTISIQPLKHSQGRKGEVSCR